MGGSGSVWVLWRNVPVDGWFRAALVVCEEPVRRREASSGLPSLRPVPGKPGKFAQGAIALGVATLPIREHVLDHDPTMSSDPMKRELATAEQLDQVRSRDVQHVGRLLASSTSVPCGTSVIDWPRASTSMTGLRTSNVESGSSIRLSAETKHVQRSWSTEGRIHLIAQRAELIRLRRTACTAAST